MLDIGAQFFVQFFVKQIPMLSINIILRTYIKMTGVNLGDDIDTHWLPRSTFFIS